MKILFLAAEVGPFVSVGGLSQVMYFLPRSLIALKNDVHIFTPKYGSMLKGPENKEWKLTQEVEGLKVPLQSHIKDDKKITEFLQCNIKEFKGKDTDPIVHFLENNEYYEMRANVFGYKDDHVRFALLSKGCLEWLRYLKQLQQMSSEEVWFPDIIHCNDWHTSYFVQLARQDKRYKDLLAGTPILLTVHNFHFQGNMQFRYLTPEEKDSNKTELEPLKSDKLIQQNALMRGILYADVVNTVSPTHALEVLTPEYGEGLENILQNVRSKITGILNGIDTVEFDPDTDPIIKKNYSKETVFDVRKSNKKDLQKTFFLPEDPNKVVLVISGRISQQKGWDLLIEVLPHLMNYDKSIQVIVLGDGEEAYRNKLQQLRVLFLDRIGLHLRGDFRLPRKLFAGGDISLMPSEFEPGGIVALEALRYGAVPLVRKTGGLADIISDFNPQTGKGNGFSFKEKDPWVLFGKIVEAISIYRQPALWQQLVRNCMEEDFSWFHAAKEYDQLYKKIITEKKRANGQNPHPAYKSLNN